MKSKIYFSSGLISTVKFLVKEISRDRISVHAAQASFFVITSAVPFISLLIAVIGVFLPQISASELQNKDIGTISEIFSLIYDELSGAPSVSLISISAITALWSASRGIGAVYTGVETVYRAEQKANIITRKVKSLISTLFFIGIILALTVLLLFGDFIFGITGVRLTEAFIKLRIPLLILVMTVFFTGVYYSVSKRSEYVKKNISNHIPGAVFASVGWIVFSYFYSLYITNFPGASYIYGGLAAICLIMLWIYFCMIILLLGAEINKLYFASLGRKTDK